MSKLSKIRLVILIIALIFIAMGLLISCVDLDKEGERIELSVNVQHIENIEII